MQKSLSALFAAAFLLLAPSLADAAPTEQLLPFKVTTTLTAGKAYKFTFSLYDTAAPGSGNRLWRESKTYTVPASKTIAHVLGSIVPFSAPLGLGSAPVDFSRQLWVEVTAATFVRRVKLTAVPYALWSATADTLGIECAPGEILVVDNDGEWACGVIPAAQLCEAGDVLGCYTGPPATQGVGVCRNGTRPCQSGAWGSCVGQTLPVAESVPGSPTYCNGVDDDCDGVIASHEADADKDGVFICDGDCDDDDPNRNPLMDEMCDGFDNNCDGVLLDGELDEDLDGFLGCDGDCDDQDPTVNQGAPEVCGDGVDNNCDGVVDEGCEACGDGAVTPGEECDDANTTDGDGCSSTCTVEQGYSCIGQPSTCTQL